MSVCLPDCSLKKQKLGEPLKKHFDAVNRTKKFFSQQITFVTKCENIELCFKGKRLIKNILVILRHAARALSGQERSKDITSKTNNLLGNQD